MPAGPNKVRLTVLFASDEGYAAHLATAIYSLLDNNKTLPIEIVLFTASMPTADIDRFETICSKHNTPLKVVWVDDGWFQGLTLDHHFKKANYYRLFAPDLIGKDVCLYLDADVVIDGPIDSLAGIDLADSYLAAVVNPGFDRHKELGMRMDSGYFNSGVMLLNLSKWRESNLKNRAIAFALENPAAIQFVDQCALNSVVDGEWVRLEPRYNVQTAMLDQNQYREYFRKQPPVVIHFTGSDKPWFTCNNHSFKRKYWSYRNMTSYSSLFCDDFGLKVIGRLLLPPWLKDLLKASLSRIGK